MNGIYEIAWRNIEVRSLHREVHILCRAYHSAQATDFSVETAQKAIDFERERSAAEDIAAGLPIRSYTDGYLETLAVYRKIADKIWNTTLSYSTAPA